MLPSSSSTAARPSRNHVTMPLVFRPTINRPQVGNWTEGETDSFPRGFVPQKLTVSPTEKYPRMGLANYPTADLARIREATRLSAPPTTISSCAAGLNGGNGNDFPSMVNVDLP